MAVDDSWEEVDSPSSRVEETAAQQPVRRQPVLLVSDANVAGDEGSLFLQLRGGLTLLFVVGVWLTGAFAPLIAVGLIYYGGRGAHTVLAGLFAVTIYPYIAIDKRRVTDDGKGRGWLAFRHAIPDWGQHWHKSCGRAYETEGPRSWETMPPTVFCYHPHGVFTQGYIINGSMNREIPKILGLLASVLYHAPLFRLVFGKWAGSCGPASKEMFLDQMSKGASFGIIPGGFQEAAITKLGTDRVWMKNRKGFIKYALRFGYRLKPVFTFGESDTYWNIQGLWKLRLWLTAKNLPGVFPWGVWWCPLLPRRVRLMSVFGEAIVLPKLEDPSKEDVDKWHAIYIKELIALHGRHKGKYARNPEGELEVW